MNLKEIEYIVKIAEERNVTHAAEKLFLTPSALNQQLLHLEREIGTQLFFRSRTGWTPTEAGEIYLNTAKEMLRMKRETYKQLQDIATTKKGNLSIGFPPERGAAMFTSVYPDFHMVYPDITINVCEVSVHRQQQLIKKGDLDIGFLTLTDSQKTDDEHIFITSEEIVLAIPTGHPLCGETVLSASGLYPELDVEKLQYEPFALMYKESTFRQLVDSIFRHAGFVPTVLFETARTHTILSMVSAKMCCGLVSSTYCLDPFPGVSFYSLPAHPTWNLMASYKKGSYLNTPAKHFISLASDYWQKKGRTQTMPELR